MNPYQEFIAVIMHVLGGTLDAAGYLRDDKPMQEARGSFRWRKGAGLINFQALYHPQSELSRFRIELTRDDETQTLSALIWHKYGARVLPSDDHWWLYKHAHDLAPQMLEAGQLLFGYGVPWLERHAGVPE